MALPTTGPLSMSAIATEQGISLSNVSLRNMSATAGFVTPDAISEFYGYSFTTVTAFGLSVAYLTDDDACNAGVWDIIRYHNGSGMFPNFNDRIFTNSAGTTVFNGGDGFFAMGDAGNQFDMSAQVIRINSNGFVQDVVTCSGGSGGGGELESPF